MSYHLYTTEGWILGSSDTGEANRYLEIFTKDLGLLRAHAQGARYLKSKQRYNLQTFSSVKVSLVCGKEIWRLTSALTIILAKDLMKDPARLQLITRVFSLLKRLVRGEDKDEKLYNDLDTSINFLIKNDLNDEFLKNFETVLVLRILSHLGYTAENKDLDGRLFFADWNIPSLALGSELRKKAISQINLALANSQL
ncbi:MAG: DNA repair protein RecO [Candidatus Vogelbacteria bacterium]|nr:DNA repair protein RecO [Candidatus Vogelbacteria bacterium]